MLYLCYVSNNSSSFPLTLEHSRVRGKLEESSDLNQQKRILLSSDSLATFYSSAGDSAVFGSELPALGFEVALQSSQSFGDLSLVTFSKNLQSASDSWDLEKSAARDVRDFKAKIVQMRASN